METNLCDNCICLPLCLNKSIIRLSKDCELFSIEIIESFNPSEGKGKVITIRFLHLKKDIKLEIYIDTIYILDNDDNESAIVGINRNRIKDYYKYK
jgi:hypothetical protein